MKMAPDFNAHSLDLEFKREKIFGIFGFQAHIYKDFRGEGTKHRNF